MGLGLSQRSFLFLCTGSNNVRFRRARHSAELVPCRCYRLFLPSGAQIFPRRIGEDVAMETAAIAEDRLRRLGVECCRAEPLIGGLEVVAVEIDEPAIARDRRVQLL